MTKKKIEWTEENKLIYNMELNKLLNNINCDISPIDPQNNNKLKNKVFKWIGLLHSSMRNATEKVTSSTNKGTKRNRWWKNDMHSMRREYKEAVKKWESQMRNSFKRISWMSFSFDRFLFLNTFLRCSLEENLFTKLNKDYHKILERIS